MEEKHIYSSSGWFKLFNFLKSYRDAFKELLSQLSKLKPKKRPASPQAAIRKTQPLAQAPKPKPKVEKPIPKEMEDPIKIPKKYSEAQIRILVYALFAAVIALMALGIYMSYKGS